MLELGLAEIVNREVIRETKGIKTNISNVSLKVWGGRKERNGFGLLSKACSRTTYCDAPKEGIKLTI